MELSQEQFEAKHRDNIISFMHDLDELVKGHCKINNVKGLEAGLLQIHFILAAFTAGLAGFFHHFVDEKEDVGEVLDALFEQAKEKIIKSIGNYKKLQQEH
jgi:hypothetical protein